MQVYISIDANIDSYLSKNLDAMKVFIFQTNSSLLKRVPPIFTQNPYTLNSGTIHTNSLIGFPAHIGSESEMFVGSRNTDNTGKSEQKRNLTKEIKSPAARSLKDSSEYLVNA